jgi:hypothetical protein
MLEAAKYRGHEFEVLKKAGSSERDIGTNCEWAWSRLAHPNREAEAHVVFQRIRPCVDLYFASILPLKWCRICLRSKTCLVPDNLPQENFARCFPIRLIRQSAGLV